MSALWATYRKYGHQVSGAVALFLVLTTGLIVEVRLLLGYSFPEGYGDWLLLLFGLAGANVAGMTALRTTSPPYVAAKAAAKANGSPSVNVEGAASIAVAVPQAGVPPTNPDVRAGLEAMAAQQQPATFGGRSQ